MTRCVKVGESKTHLSALLVEVDADAVLTPDLCVKGIDGGLCTC